MQAGFVLSGEVAVFLRLQVTKICSEFVLCANSKKWSVTANSSLFSNVIIKQNISAKWGVAGVTVDLSGTAFLLEQPVVRFSLRCHSSRGVYDCGGTRYDTLQPCSSRTPQRRAGTCVRAKVTVSKGNPASCARADGCRWRSRSHSCPHLPRDDRWSILRMPWHEIQGTLIKLWPAFPIKVAAALTWHSWPGSIQHGRLPPSARGKGSSSCRCSSTYFATSLERSAAKPRGSWCHPAEICSYGKSAA